jgi:putative SOS response-associated peptidase YedK
MCGRYALHSHPDVVAMLFGLSEVPAYAPRFNIAPMSQVLIVRGAGQPAAALVRWGLVPRWVKDPAKAAKMHNARAETVAERPSFRDAYRSRRCLMPANGFYEWHDGPGGKQPFYVRPANEELFSLAALWELWRGPQGVIESCAVITTEANATMAKVHDRMPVIIAPGDRAAWLSGAEGLLRPAPDAALRIQKVSRAVNDGRRESPDLIEPED